MQQFYQFLERNFIWFFLFCFAWVLVAFAWRYYRHKQRGIVFPDVASQRVQFHEQAASGCSHKTGMV
jgi:predicted negative regulator of RcsB-dependent stress response